jgi:hypothetical protein
MKDLFKKITKPLLFVSLILLFSCEKDLYEEPLKKETTKFSVEMKEVTNKSDVISKLRKKFPTKLKTSSYARGSGTLLVLQGDFGKVKLDNVLEVAKANDISYSFEIDETVKSSNVYLNLVIDKNDNIWLYKVDKIVQQYKDYPINSERLVRYKLNPDLTEQSSTPCDTIIFPPFQPDPTGSSTTSGGGGGTGNWQNTPPSGGFFPPFIFHTPGGSSSGDSSTSGGGIGEVVSAFASAIGDAWNWLVELFHSPPCGCHKYSNVVIVDVPEGPCGEGGAISIIPQSPVLDKIYELNELLGNQLKYEDKNYFYYNDGRYLDYFLDLAQNPPTDFNYYDNLPKLITHVRTTGDFDFVQQLVVNIIANPLLQFDVNYSYKSPVNIDKSSITNETSEGQKFNEVYEALTKSQEFKRLFLDLFEDNNRFNVKFQIGAVTNGANGNTDTDLSNPTLNIITISPQFLLNSNKMEIAKTIIHECIHAYLNIKMVDPSIGMSIPNLNNMEFCDVVNQQYNNFSTGQNQHNFIYNYMLPTMETILSQVKDFLVSPANNQVMLNDVVVHIPYDYSPATPFVWTDYYHNLCLNGLQNCSFFQNEIGTVQVVNGIPTPVITVNQTLMQSFIQYITRGHFNINN